MEYPARAIISGAMKIQSEGTFAFALAYDVDKQAFLATMKTDLGWEPSTNVGGNAAAGVLDQESLVWLLQREEVLVVTSNDESIQLAGNETGGVVVVGSDAVGLRSTVVLGCAFLWAATCYQ